MLGRVETDVVAINLGGKYRNRLHRFEAAVVDDVGVLACPDRRGVKVVTLERARDGSHHGLAGVHDVAWNLPEAAAVEVTRGLLFGRVQQQELDATRGTAEDPDVEDVRLELHGSRPFQWSTNTMAIPS